MILPLLSILFGIHGSSLQEIPKNPETEVQSKNAFCQLCENTFYYYVGTALESASLAAKCAWGLSYISPGFATFGKECYFLSELCDSMAKHSFAQMFKGSSVLKQVPLSQTSWHQNKSLLSQIPALTPENESLLHFLEKRWLAKATGFFSSMIDWACPCFGITLQVNPETTGCVYARSPSIKLSKTYTNRVEDWKKSLPHPLEYPLILTRPFDLRHYLPSCLTVSLEEKIEDVIDTVIALQKNHSPLCIDLTDLFSDGQKWQESWENFRQSFLIGCQKKDVDLEQIFCFQRVQQAALGGIRLLPLSSTVDKHHEFLLGWISNFGLSANFIELDRWANPPKRAIPKRIPFAIPSKEKMISFLKTYQWASENSQKTLMVHGTLQVLSALLDQLSPEKWNEVINCPTKSSITSLAFDRIQQQLQLIAEKERESSFFETACHLEQIHADLSSLLEIFSLFEMHDFAPIYRDLLNFIPESLKPLTSYALHASGMTSVAGIFKAVERTVGKTPRVLYGENTYFECINAAHLVSNASPIEEAMEEDWKNVDLILAQFNPVLKKVDSPNIEYKTERVSEVLHRALKHKKPITLALDCTLDLINSNRVRELLTEFQEEIQNGFLNIVCYRSGLKFDLFGMDNYCGAPLFMIHGPSWTAFDALLEDPALQTDDLSLNWFCLAYQNAAAQLELYQKQVFENTRAFLNKIPPRLFNKKSPYRIIPVEEGADPAFIDIKITGPFHQMRGSTLVGGCLSVKCMEKGQPIFYRPSLGLYHPNFTMIFGETCTTMRLTLGLDPAQVDVLVNCLSLVDTLNDSIFTQWTE